MVYPDAPASGNFTKFISIKDFDLSRYAGETIRIAFRYRATAAKCWAWEVKYLTLMAVKDATGILASPIAEAEIQETHYHTLDGVSLGHRQPSKKGIYLQRRGTRRVKIYVR